MLLKLLRLLVLALQIRKTSKPLLSKGADLKRKTELEKEAPQPEAQPKRQLFRLPRNVKATKRVSTARKAEPQVRNLIAMTPLAVHSGGPAAEATNKRGHNKTSEDVEDGIRGRQNARARAGLAGHKLLPRSENGRLGHCATESAVEPIQVGTPLGLLQQAMTRVL